MGNEENLLGGITPAIQPNSNTPIHSPNDFGLNILLNNININKYFYFIKNNYQKFILYMCELEFDK